MKISINPNWYNVFSQIFKNNQKLVEELKDYINSSKLINSKYSYIVNNKYVDSKEKKEYSMFLNIIDSNDNVEYSLLNNIIKIVLDKRNLSLLETKIKNVLQMFKGKKRILKIFFDGSFLNNNKQIKFIGQSYTSGTIFYLDDIHLFNIESHIKIYGSNNIAEYFGLLNGLIFLDFLMNLSILHDYYISTIIVGDSNLVIQQMTGNFKVNNEKIILYNYICRSLIGSINRKTLFYRSQNSQGKFELSFIHVLREENELANYLTKTAYELSDNSIKLSMEI